ncbi:flavin-containing monooxygenase [Nocardia mexicana]|uniref:Putative flavoprotein involved in K+ transport n=1 Tax=Nocardia mexicana TaxID=279262 RepID=A0A370HDP8_9NOCA|nr:NAD(P)/FAD-dependent oxidoreductase [Nocardia mexicana]RDI55185.1 putative flavoprotein involved in K+ transport [Nocardia mexicana]
MPTEYDAIVVGGGQAGLAAAHHLTHHRLSVLVLEAGPDPTGSWHRYYDSLTLFSPAKYSALPGISFPGDPDRYPHRDEVADYLRDYATRLAADIRTGHRVDTVTHDGHRFTAHTGHVSFTAPRLVAATGSFDNPHLPQFPGRDGYTGTLVHASDYRNPHEFEGQRVIVVGAGNSAVQIAAELAATTDVTLASRAPVKFVPQRPLGKDVHFWFTVTGFDRAPLGRLLRTAPTQPVLDTGRYRAALTAGKPARRDMFTRLDGDNAVWADGTRTRADTIIAATGYRPHLPYLADLGALTPGGLPRHRAGVSTTHAGLGYLGLEWQRTPASNSLRGVGRDAAHLARHPKILAPEARTGRERHVGA